MQLGMSCIERRGRELVPLPAVVFLAVNQQGSTGQIETVTSERGHFATTQTMIGERAPEEQIAAVQRVPLLSLDGQHALH